MYRVSWRPSQRLRLCIEFGTRRLDYLPSKSAYRLPDRSVDVNSSGFPWVPGTSLVMNANTGARLTPST